MKMLAQTLMLALLLTLAACGGGDDFPTDISTLSEQQLGEAIMELDPDVAGVALNISSAGMLGLEVNIKVKSLWDDASAVSYPMITMHRVCSDLFQARGSGKIHSMEFFVNIPTKDKYGNEGIDLAYSLQFSGNDLQKINWKNANSFLLSNFAKIRKISHLGRTAFREYCTENAKDSPYLCGQLF